MCCSDAGKDSVWLIAPLIAKLSGVVQGRILKHAGQVLETGNNFWTAKNTRERERYLQKRFNAEMLSALIFDLHCELKKPQNVFWYTNYKAWPIVIKFSTYCAE